MGEPTKDSSLGPKGIGFKYSFSSLLGFLDVMSALFGDTMLSTKLGEPIPASKALESSKLIGDSY